MLQIPVFGNCHPSVTLKTPLIDLEMSMCIVDATKRYIYFFLRWFLSSIIAKPFTRLDNIYVLHGGCLIRSRNCLPFASIWVHPGFDGQVRVNHIFSFLYCLIVCLYVLISVLWCPLPFPHKNDVRFVFTSSCL